MIFIQTCVRCITDVHKSQLVPMFIEIGIFFRIILNTKKNVKSISPEKTQAELSYWILLIFKKNSRISINKLLIFLSVFFVLFCYILCVPTPFLFKVKVCMFLCKSQTFFYVDVISIYPCI